MQEKYLTTSKNVDINTLQCYNSFDNFLGKKLKQMREILVAFPGEKTREYIVNLLKDAGIPVLAACGTGMETVTMAKRQKVRIVLAGEGLCDMDPQDLRECLPKNVYMILLARETALELCQGEIIKVPAPASQQKLVETVMSVENTLAQIAAEVPKRSSQDKELIAKAKHRIMDEKSFSEEEAYRFIQRCSMNLGFKMVYTAQEILSGNISL